MASEEVTDAAASNAAADAKARREARKARILGAGNDRLARITKTGRGGEADVLYSTPPKPLGGGIETNNQTPKGSIDDDEVLQRANAALRGGTGSHDDDPQDVDISQPSAQNNPFLAMMQQQQQGQGQHPDMPQDLQGMMRAMQEAMMNASQGQAGENASGQAPPFPFGPGAATAQQEQVQKGPSAVDAIFNLARALIFAIFGIALVYGALIGKHAEATQSVAEKASERILDQFAHMPTLHRWARLAYEKPAHWEAKYFTMESFGLPIPEGVPIFWIFITLEIGLQSMRIMLQRRRPSPPGFLLKVASFIPNANIQLLIRTLASYLPLLDAFINDIAVVVFTIGCAILFASWKAGFDPLLAPSDSSIPYGSLADTAREMLTDSAHSIPDIINPAGPPM